MESLNRISVVGAMISAAAAIAISLPGIGPAAYLICQAMAADLIERPDF